jgi:hypothetical protein
LKPTGGVDVSTPHGEQFGRQHPSRIRWLVGVGLAVAVIIGVVLIAVYSGGGGPGGGY